MNEYDPDQHRIDTDAWERQKNRQSGRVTIDRWTKDGQSYVSLAYWARTGRRRQDEYRVHVVAATLEEAIFRAEQKEAQTVLSGFYHHGG